MEFRILGPLEVLVAGRRVALGSRERIILALLLLSANQVVSSERLIDDAWAGNPPEGAARTLRVYISRLRKALGQIGGDGPVLTRVPGYLLRVEPGSLDAANFEALVTEGREQLAEGRHREAAATIRAALSLWRGTVLADLVDAPFARAEAARLEETRLSALEDRVEADLACGRHGEVLPELDTLIRAQPLRERLWAQKMLALYRAARQAEALRAYQEVRRLLGEELGIEPGVTLRRLETAILRHDLDLEGPPPPADPAPATRRRRPPVLAVPIPPELAVESAAPPFVGRSAEVQLAEEMLSDPTRDRLAVLWLLGEPGIGKTRLARELAHRAHRRGAVVLFGCCSEDLPVPYQPFLEALRWFVAHVPDDQLANRLGELPGDLTRLLPQLGRRLAGLEASRSTSPEIEQYHLFEAIRSWLATGSGDQPMVAVFDDVHWAARPTLALLGHVARSAGHSRGLLVCTARNTSPDDNEALAALTDELDRRGVPSRRLELAGLGVEAVGELVESAAGRNLDERLRTLAVGLQVETAGNPLFVDALLASFPAPEGWSPGELPRTLTATVAHRVGRLPAGVADLLRVASVAGLDFDLRVVASASGSEELEALEGLDRATKAGLLEEAGADRYRFAHALVRYALRGQLSQSRRVRIHLRVAEALEAVGDTDEHASELAHHFFEAVPAGGAAKAYHYAILEAERAMRLLSHHEAVTAYRRAIELMLPERDSLKRSDLLLACCEAELRAGYFSAARGTIRAAAEEATGRGSPEHLARAAVAFDRASAHLGVSGIDSLALLQRAETALPREYTPLRALTLAALGRALVFSGQRDEAMARGEEALAVARRVGDPATTAGVLLRNLYAYRGVENALEYRDRASELTRLAQELDDDELYLFASFGHDEAASCLGDLKTWDKLLADQDRLIHMIRQPYCEHDVMLRRYLRAMVAAELAPAEESLQRAGEIGGRLGWGLEGLYALGTFLLRREQGRLAGVGPALQGIVRQTPALWSPGLAVLYAEIGELDNARAEFDRLAADDFAGVPNDGTRLLCIGLMAEACAALGDAARAPWLLAQLRPCEGRFLVFTGMAACLGPADRLLAKLASVAGARARAEHWYEQALQLVRDMPSPLWTAHCLYDLGLHLRATDARRAEAMLAEAATLCQRHGLVGLGLRVEAERPRPAS